MTRMVIGSFVSVGAMSVSILPSIELKVLGVALALIGLVLILSGRAA
jgi:hypothetical protein